MNLEQIVKETVAKIVAEKQGKDLTGDGKIDSKDYLKARSMAINKAKDNMDEAVGNFELKKLAREFYSVIKPIKGVAQVQVKTSNDILKTKFGGQGKPFTAGVSKQTSAMFEGKANVYIEVHEKENALQVVIGGEDKLMDVAQRIDQALTAFVIKNYKDQLQAEYGKSNDGSLVYITVRLKQATNETEKLAEDGLNEDYEVAMAQDSLDSIIRAAMMLKAQMGDKEVNLPAWIQDHITNSENYINQAAKGYHESDAQIDDEAGAEEMNEANLGHNETSSISQEGRFWIVTYQTADGTKEKSFESEDEARAFYNTLDEAKESNDDKIAKYEKYTYTLDGETVKPEITFLNNILKAILGNKIYNIGSPKDGKVELTPESGKKGTYTESTELDEWTVSRWQHYAGIK